MFIKIISFPGSDFNLSQVESFLNDFERALAAAIDFDNQLESNALEISADYADLVALATRQTLGSWVFP